MNSDVLRTLLMIAASTAATSAATLHEFADQPELPQFSTALSAERVATLQQFRAMPATRLLPASAQSAEVPPLSVLAPDSAADGARPRQAPPLPDPLPPPLTPQEITMRDALRKIGSRRDRYVQCELQGGRRITGTIKAIEDRSFTLRVGILDDDEKLYYWQLTAPPHRVRAIRQRTAHSVERGVLIGLVGVGVILAVVLLVHFGDH